MIAPDCNFFHAPFFPFIFSFFLPLNPRRAPQNLSQNLHFGTMLTASFCARYTAVKQTASDETTDSPMDDRKEDSLKRSGETVRLADIQSFAALRDGGRARPILI